MVRESIWSFIACYRCFKKDVSEVWESRMPIVESLVEKGKADVNFVKNETKITALHWAALNNDLSAVVYLLSHGAEMFTSKQHQTPIDVACLCNYRMIADCIIENWWKKLQQ